MRGQVSSLITVTMVAALLAIALAIPSGAEIECAGQGYKILILKFDNDVNGTIIVNSTIRRTISFGFRPRQIEVPVYQVYDISGSSARLCIPSSIGRFSIMGPFSREIPYVPFKINLDTSILSNGSILTLEWPAEVGLALSVPILPFLNGSYPTVALEASQASTEHVGNIRFLLPHEQMILGSMVPELFFTAYRVVLPNAGEVTIRIVSGASSVEFKKIIEGPPGAEFVFQDISQFILEVNREDLNKEFDRVRYILGRLESNGYYLGSSRQLLSLAESIARGGEPSEEIFRQKLAFTLLTDLESNLSKLLSGPSFVYTFSLLASVLILSLAVGWQLFDRWQLKLISTLLLFAAFLAVLIAILPTLRLEVTAFAVATVLGLFFGLRGVLRLKPIQGASTASGATLEGLLSSTVSFSLSFLSRRKLRAALLLLTCLLMAFGVTCLSSSTMYAAISTQRSDSAASVEAPYLVVRGYSPLGPVNVRGLAFLGGREEVQVVAPNAILFYPTTPFDRIGQTPVNCIVGLSRDSPLAGLVGTTLIEGSMSGLRSGTIVVSDAAAKSAGLKVGDEIELGGNTFIVVGIFESQALSKLKDLDGDDVLPTVAMGMSSYKPPAESTVFLHYNDAVLAGAATNKVYVKLSPGANVSEIARLVSLLGGASVYAVEPGKPVEVHYPGFKLEIRGAELIVPSVIALMIVFTAFAGFTYEVRRDIFTLSTLGATPDQVFMVFTVMACIVGFTGGTLGYIFGMLAFRLFNVLDAGIPVDVKVDATSLLYTILVTTGLALFGALSPASRAVVAAVPSLRRRWMLVAEETGRDEVEREVTLVTPIPVVIRNPQQAARFTEFIESRLKSLSGQSIFNVTKWEEGADGEKAVVVYFEFYQVEGRAFKSYNKLWVRKKDGSYFVELESKVVTIYTMFARELFREVASLVRRLALEWRTEIS